MGTKNRIMEESLKLFLKNGFSDVSLSEIKQSSNITTGGFYHYFQSKDDLLIEVIETYIFDYFKSTMLRLRKCTGTPQDKLKIVMLSLIGDAHLSDSVIIDYRTLHMLLMEGVKKFKPVSEKYSEFYNSLLDFILEVVEEGIDQGTIRNDIDPVELATSIETTMVGNILMGIAMPEIPLKTRVNITIGCIWEFISLNHTA
ncbi:MAG TPA: TetR/AcrR family transcriptional regulator [Methanobacterium sp.]|nr:MAG: TetR/AcrR family transcriptional regulator [Methanobacterium sp.]HOI71058.1 TetR/AcrR family transcriptional regulator [Methanobacterium sp.]